MFNLFEIEWFVSVDVSTTSVGKLIFDAILSIFSRPCWSIRWRYLLHCPSLLRITNIQKTIVCRCCAIVFPITMIHIDDMKSTGNLSTSREKLSYHAFHSFNDIKETSTDLEKNSHIEQKSKEVERRCSQAKSIHHLKLSVTFLQSSITNFRNLFNDVLKW